MEANSKSPVARREARARDPAPGFFAGPASGPKRTIFWMRAGDSGGVKIDDVGGFKIDDVGGFKIDDVGGVKIDDVGGVKIDMGGDKSPLAGPCKARFPRQTAR